MTTNIYLARLIADERERDLRGQYRRGYRLVKADQRTKTGLLRVFRTPRRRVTDTWVTAT